MKYITTTFIYNITCNNNIIYCIPIYIYMYIGYMFCFIRKDVHWHCHGWPSGSSCSWGLSGRSSSTSAMASGNNLSSSRACTRSSRAILVLCVWSLAQVQSACPPALSHANKYPSGLPCAKEPRLPFRPSRVRWRLQCLPCPWSHLATTYKSSFFSL